MTTIPTSHGEVTIEAPSPVLLRNLRAVLPFGACQLSNPGEDPTYAIAMQCDEKEVYCIKQQPLECDRENAGRWMDIQHWMCVEALTTTWPGSGSFAGSGDAASDARVQGQHIVPVFDAGVVCGEGFLIQPYIDGIDLRELLERCHSADLVLPDGLVLDLFKQATLGVREIHAAGVIHRDVKPPNIFLRGDGSVVVGDFGISATNRRKVDGFGTPGFLAPEVRDGCTADFRSDLYALGSTLDCLLQTQLPPTNGPIRQGLRAIATRLQAELPRDRYQNTKELLAALGQLTATNLKLKEIAASEVEIGSLRVRVWRGDLTNYRADAIVSAANVWMVMDQGVAKALKDRGGVDIESEAHAHGKVAMGAVIWTFAGQLQAQYVAHAVSALDGAICLQRCALRCLLGAERRKVTSIAFPALGTGVARVPMRLAARRILDAIRLFGEMRPNHVRKVDLVLADEKAQRIWIEALEDMKEAE
ncbi:MAG: serine/threonine-protein kinase [Verrucomicrobiota bacterium]